MGYNYCYRARPRLLSEVKRISGAVSYCATCDGAFKDKKVAATRQEEVLFLTRFARQVTIIHPVAAGLCFRNVRNTKINFHWDL